MSSLLCAGIVTPLVAAPPAITAVSPPAVQVGTTATLALAGKPGNAPIEAWCDRPELSVSMTGEKPQLQVEVPADAVPGLCWLRFYNAEGCTAPVPLLVGVLPQVDDKEPNNLPREAQELKSLPVAVQGVLLFKERRFVFCIGLSYVTCQGSNKHEAAEQEDKEQAKDKTKLSRIPVNQKC